MPPHRLIVARAFQIVGWGVGAPSLLAAIWLGVGAILVAAGPAPQKPHYLAIGTYGLVGLLSNAATAVGGVLGALNQAAAWIMGALAIAALIATAAAALLYLIGCGLKAAATWARLTAAILLTILTLNCVLALSALHGGAAFADAGLAAVFGYGLWVLG